MCGRIENSAWRPALRGMEVVEWLVCTRSTIGCAGDADGLHGPKIIAATWRVARRTPAGGGGRLDSIRHQGAD